MEHRWGDRVRSDAIVRVLADPASVAWGRVRDISTTGAFIETKLALRPLATLHIARSWQSPGERAPEVGAIVVRTAPDGVGIEWFHPGSHEVLSMIAEARNTHDIRPVRRAPSVLRRSGARS